MQSSRLINWCAFFPSCPQKLYLVATALSVVGERSVCHTPRCSSKNWKESMPPINSSPKTKGEGYLRRRTWQRDKWQSGFRTGAWRRRKSSINLRVPVSSEDGERRTWMALYNDNNNNDNINKLCYNLLLYERFRCRQRGSVLSCTFPSHVLIGTSLNGLLTEDRKCFGTRWPRRFCVGRFNIINQRHSA